VTEKSKKGDGHIKNWRLTSLPRIPDDEWEETIRVIGFGGVTFHVKPNQPVLAKNRADKNSEGEESGGEE